MDLSVIICTHNPHEDYLRRVLSALDKQTLSKDRWELLLIDNVSKEALAGKWDLSWHPHSRHIREDELGLTPARIRGISESKGNLLVFVDDDNALRFDYLDKALSLTKSHPNLGIFGGSCKGIYESPPPSWFERHKGWVGVRDIMELRWSNDPLHAASTPIGAGMAILRSVAVLWVEEVTKNQERSGLGRKGNSLMSGEDIDMAYSACRNGYGKGVFPELELDHMIPQQRYTIPYMEKLIEMAAYSKAIHHKVIGLPSPEPQKGKFRVALRKTRAFLTGDVDRRLWEAWQLGLCKAHKKFKSSRPYA